MLCIEQQIWNVWRVICLALLTCPECGGIVSDLAVCCPHCGCPIEAIVNASSSEIIISINDANKKQRQEKQDKEICLPEERDDALEEDISEELRAENLMDLFFEKESDINILELYDTALDDDPFDDPQFNWEQYVNGGIYPIKISDKDDLENYDIEDMGLDPNFYADDGNGF